MKLFIKFQDNNKLPEIADLVKIMWKENINYSIVTDSANFKDCTTLSLAWDKWIDDKRWVSHPKSKEYIYFDQRKELGFFYIIVMEMEDDAIEVDKCAFYKATVLIGEKTNGEISVDGSLWLNTHDYAQTINDYLKLSFDEAVELSLTKKI